MRTALKTIEARIEAVKRKRGEIIPPEVRAAVAADIDKILSREAPPLHPTRWISKEQHDRLTVKQQVSMFCYDIETTGVSWDGKEETMSEAEFSKYVKQLDAWTE